MSGRLQLVVLAVLASCSAAWAESSQEAMRRAMEASVARQMTAVAAMRLSVEKQRAAAVPGAAPVSLPIEAPFFTLTWPALGAACDPMSGEELNPLLQKAAQETGVEQSLLRAVAEEESGFRPCAVSAKGRSD